MSEGTRLTRNVFFSAATYSSSFVIFFLFVLAARLLGSESYGRFAYAFTLVQLFTQLTGYSMQNRAVIEIARDRSRLAPVFGNLLSIQFLFSVGTYALIVLTAFLIEPRQEVRLLILVLGVAMIARSFKVSLRFLLKGLERFDLETFMVAGGQALLLVVGTSALLMKRDVLIFATALAGIRILDLIASYLWVGRHVDGARPRFDFDRWGSLTRTGLHYAAVILLADLHFRAGTVLLGHMRSDAEVGWFNAAFRLIEAFDVFSLVLGFTLLPTLSAAFIRSKDRFIELYRRGIKYLLMAGGFFFVYLSFAGPAVVDVVFGSGYEEAGPVLRLLAIGLFPMIAIRLSSNALFAVDRPRAALACHFVALIAHLALAALLIPAWGIAGIAMTLVITQAFLFISMNTILHVKGFGMDWIGSYWRLGLALIPVVAGAWFTREWTPFFSFPVCAVLYLAAIFVVGVLDGREKQVIAELRNKLG